MSRLTSIRRLVGAGLAAGAAVLACRTSEAPPLAPRPERNPALQPVPGAPDPLSCPSGVEDAGVVPAPRPIPGVTTNEPPLARGAVAIASADQAAPADAAVEDAVNLPPVTDANLPADASRLPR